MHRPTEGMIPYLVRRSSGGTRATCSVFRSKRNSMMLRFGINSASTEFVHLSDISCSRRAITLTTHGPMRCYTDGAGCLRPYSQRRNPLSTPLCVQGSGTVMYRKAVGINVLNPKVAICFFGVSALIRSVRREHPTPVAGIRSSLRNP